MDGFYFCLNKFNEIDLPKEDAHWDSVMSVFLSNPLRYQNFFTFADELFKRRTTAATSPPAKSPAPALPISSPELTALTARSIP
jgi:hypothetical protein